MRVAVRRRSSPAVPDPAESGRSGSAPRPRPRAGRRVAAQHDVDARRAGRARPEPLDPGRDRRRSRRCRRTARAAGRQDRSAPRARCSRRAVAASRAAGRRRLRSSAQAATTAPGDAAARSGASPCTGGPVRDHEQAAPRRQRLPLAAGVRGLHAGPRLQQRDRGPAGPLARPGSGSARPCPVSMIIRSSRSTYSWRPPSKLYPKAAFEPGVGQVPVVGLDEAALADRGGAGHGRADRHDPGTRPRGRARSAGRPGRSSGSRPAPRASRPAVTSALAEVAREGVEQLGVGEADADRLDPRSRICVGPGTCTALARLWTSCPGPTNWMACCVGGEGAAARLGSVRHGIGSWSAVGWRHQLSITWPPVTGRAWPVSYCWSTR